MLIILYDSCQIPVQLIFPIFMDLAFAMFYREYCLYVDLGVGIGHSDGFVPTGLF